MPAGPAGSIASALAERERWCTTGLDNAARFSTQAMTDGYLTAMALDVLRRKPQTPPAEGLADRGSTQKRESN